jgi:lipopolysaccharide/colanic/teichoic acid biosynthesis glycosyltransferase
MSGAEQMHMFHLPMLRSKRFQPLSEYRTIKRVADIVFSGIALIFCSPIMLVTAIAVKMDGGPVFYKQTRLTQNAREFKILKFRSMCVDAEKMSGAVLSSGKNDPRITKVGRFIRSCRIDEMPQLINIFLGDMSIVGPRPERPEIAAVYEKELPEFRLRLQAKAGLTGYAQVYGKYNTTPYDKLLMDLMYISCASLFMDLRIAIETLRILFDKESTEGLEDEGVTLQYSERKVERRRRKTD